MLRRFCPYGLSAMNEYSTARIEHLESDAILTKKEKRGLGKWERCHFVKFEVYVLNLINIICEKYAK